MRHKKVTTSREKLLIIEEYLSTSKSSRELEKKYNVSQSTIARWGREFKSASTSETVKNNDNMPSDSKSDADKDLEIKLLKKALKDKEDKITVLEMTISKASELFGVDVKKKLDTK
jgi:transposase